MRVVFRNRGLGILLIWLPAAACWAALVWGLIAVPAVRVPIAFVLAAILAWPVVVGVWIMFARARRIVVDDEGISEHFFGSRRYAWDEIVDARLVAGPRGGMIVALGLTLRRRGSATTSTGGVRILGTDADPDELLALVRARMTGKA